MPSIIKRKAGGQHKVLPRNKGHPQLLVGIEYPYRFHGIVENCAICKRNGDRISEVYVLEYLKMVSVPMAVNHTNTFFTGICRGFEPARRLIERCVIDADRHGDVCSEDRERICLTVNRRGVRRGSRLRCDSDNRRVRNDRTWDRGRGIRKTSFPWIERHAGCHIGVAGNGWVSSSVRFSRFPGQ